MRRFSKTRFVIFFRYDPQGASAASTGQKQKVLLDENDELWAELRHQHIAEVLTLVIFEENLSDETIRDLLGMSIRKSRNLPHRNV